MEVWYAIPTACPERANIILPKWRAMGYKVAVLIDAGAPRPDVDLVVEANPYPGYWVSVNRLCQQLRSADIVVTGGDDIEPDPKHSAETIAAGMRGRFPDLCGIYQPLGDDWQTRACCVSPWMGRGWLERAYGGNGPLWPGYFAFFGDQELFEVSSRLGLLWMDEGVSQIHHHSSRRDGLGWPMQPHNIRANNYWDADKTLFYARQAAGFPGHELRPA